MAGNLGGQFAEALGVGFDAGQIGLHGRQLAPQQLGRTAVLARQLLDRRQPRLHHVLPAGIMLRARQPVAQLLGRFSDIDTGLRQGLGGRLERWIDVSQGCDIAFGATDCIMRGVLIGIVDPFQGLAYSRRQSARMGEQQAFPLKCLQFARLQVKRLQFLDLVGQQIPACLSVLLGGEEGIALLIQR